MNELDIHLRVKNYLAFLEFHPNGHTVEQLVAIINNDPATTNEEKQRIIKDMIETLERGGGRRYAIPLRK
jgi:hypothetical protein